MKLYTLHIYFEHVNHTKIILEENILIFYYIYRGIGTVQCVVQLFEHGV